MIARNTPNYTILGSTPTSAVAVCSPITGDPDLTLNASISDVQSMVIGFITPCAGILTEIHMITQRYGVAAGNATSQNIRWSVCTVRPTSAANTVGIEIGEVLATGITTVAPSIVGNVTLVSGLTLAVPQQFIVVVKAPFKFVEADKIFVQNCKSAGPIAGVFGVAVGRTILSTAGYTTTPTDFDAVTPRIPVAGDTIAASQYKGLAIYTNWRC